MVSSMPQSTAKNGGGKGETGGQLLQELEALSQALYRAAGQSNSSATGTTAAAGGGKSLFSRHSASSVQANPLDPAEKSDSRPRLSTSGLLLPPARSRDRADIRARNDRRGPQLWHSQSFDKQVPGVGNFPEWVHDNINFSQKLQVSQQQEEKKSFWKWKPFRAIAHIGQQRFHVIFSLHVHSIEGLPAAMNGLRLTVHWNRKEEGLQTMPSRVFQGVAEFEETLRQRCTVYGSKSPNHGIKYESKFFTLSVVALDVDEMEFGKHRLDLSRLLPDYPGGMDDDDKPGSWTTNFKLTGKAKGGTLVVTFNYDLVHHETTEESDAAGDRLGSRRSALALGFNSVPNSTHGSPRTRPSNPLASPSHSEPGADSEDYLTMDYLNLDDDGGNESHSRSGVEGSSSPVSGLSGLQGGLGSLFEFKPTLKYFPRDDEQVDFTFPPTQSRYGDYDGQSIRHYDETDFSVQDRGIQVSYFSGDVVGMGAEGEKSRIMSSTGERNDEMPYGGSREGEEWNEVQEHVGNQQEADSMHFLASSGVSNNGLDGEGLGAAEEKIGGSGQDESEFPRRRENHSSMDCEADLDDEVDLVAGEFLNMLEIGNNPVGLNSDSDPDSPRARLLKQFEQEALLEGGIGLGLNVADMPEFQLNGTTKKQNFEGSCATSSLKEPMSWGIEDAFELASIMEAAESELQKATQTMRSKTRAKMLEDAETEALLQQWGLDEKAFESSPPKSANRFGSPMHPAKMKASEPPPLGRGLGEVIKMRDGGSLRSMSPSHFQKSRTNGSLVMQVSRPVVVPSEMGCSTLDILRHLAASGVENLAMQAMSAMPLEDITGKTVEEVAAEGIAGMHLPDQREGFSFHHRNRYPSMDAFEGQSRQGSELEQVSVNRKRDARVMQSPPKSSGWSSSEGNLGGHKKRGTLDDYVSLEDLAPLAMQNIEALAIGGLKIQADMAEEEPPSYLDAAAWGTLEDLEKRDRGSIGMSQGVAGVHFDMFEARKDGLSEVKHGDPLSMAITLEEWTRLDAGLFDDVESNNKTLAILAAHKAKHPDWGLTKREESERGSQGHARRWGIMGNTLMIAMLVQLRDPFRNYEPVGAPMMALVQAERVMVPPKPRIGRRVSTKGNSEEDEEVKEVTEQKQEAPQFKITGVHMSGLKTGEDKKEEDKKKEGRGGEDEKKKGWGNQKQQQSGSRWLIAQGMGKTSKHSLLKSKPAPAKTKVKPGETLWSISARVNGSGEKWREVAALNPHIRNPDVIFADDTIRTR